MRSKNNSILFSENLILLFLFILAGMNFKAKFFYFVFDALLVHIVLNRKIRIDKSIIWYVVFTIVYAVYALKIGWMDTIRKFAFAGCYILGFNTTLLASEQGGLSCDKQERWLEACIGSVAIGSWLHLMLNMLINRGSTGTRNTLDVWTRLPMAATGQAALAILMLAVGIVWFLLPQKKYMRIVGAGGVASILVYNLMLGGRTILVLTALLLLTAVTFIFTSRQISWSKKQNVIRTMVLLLLCIAIVFAFDVAGIRRSILESTLVDRFSEAETTDDLLEDGRLEKKGVYLQHMIEFPLGGLHLRERYGFAHDLLLDAYDECGVVMLISLIGILVNALGDVWKTIKARNITARVKCLIGCVYLAFLIEFCMEPIFAGMPWLFACFALISGCIRGVVCTNE